MEIKPCKNNYPEGYLNKWKNYERTLLDCDKKIIKISSNKSVCDIGRLSCEIFNFLHTNRILKNLSRIDG